MRKVKCLLIFVILLVLSGCSERELTFERTYPDTAYLDDKREKRKQEIEKEQKDIAAYIIDRNSAPRELLLTVKLEKEDTQDRHGYIARPIQYCWAITLEECERIQPIHPNDDKRNTLGTLRIAANQKFSLSNFLDIVPNPVPLPARIEAYIYDENKNLYLHETVYGTTPGSEFLFTAPNPGFYIFQFKAYYEGDVQGVSYHPHGITVTSEE